MTEIADVDMVLSQTHQLTVSETSPNRFTFFVDQKETQVELTPVEAIRYMAHLIHSVSYHKEKS